LHVKVVNLLYASSKGQVEDVKRLLREGVAVDAVDYDRRSALHVAASDGHTNVIAALLEARADVNPKDRWGRTPLDEAKPSLAPEACNMLIAAGAVRGADAADEEKPTTAIESAVAMCCAAAAGALPLLQDLHSRGMDINAADYDGRAALMIAASHGHADIVKWLVEARANVNAKDNFGYNATAEAARHGHENIVKILAAAGAPSGEVATMKHQAEDGSWGIPLAEIEIQKKLSKTLKSIIYLATWRGTTVVCKSTGELARSDSKGALAKNLSNVSMQLAAGEGLSETEAELVREINLLSKLRHPDLVMFLGACVDHTPPLVLTEYMEGGDLERYYRTQAEKLGHPYRPTVAKLLKWSSSVARALAFLHGASRPIIHRDLKPMNLLLSKGDDLKVTDFGISKLMSATSLPGKDGVGGQQRDSDDEDDNVKPKMSGGVGTWRYMAPEVVRYEQYTDRVDIYSYALILWFMNTGRVPFIEQFGNDAEVVLKEYLKGKEPRPDISALKCPAPFRTLVQDCWHVQASQRPSAVDCTKRLAAILATHHDVGLMDSLKKHLHIS